VRLAPLFPSLPAVIVAASAGLSSCTPPTQSGASSPETTFKQDAPRIEVSTLELDLGTIPNDKVTESQISVRNVGGSLLELQEPRTSCGCMKASLDTAQLAPGAEAKVRIEFDPFKLGSLFEVTKRFAIMSNDPLMPTVSIKVLAKVDPEFSVTPRSLRFGEVPAGTTARMMAVLRQLGEEHIEITGVEVSPSTSSIEFSYAERPVKEWTSPDRPEYVITATVLPDAAPGRHKANCHLGLACARIKSFRIWASATIKPFYDISARGLLFGTVKAGRRKKDILQITADRAFEVSDLVITSEELRVTNRPRERGKVAIFDLEVLPTAKKGIKQTTVTFTISSGEESYKERIPLQCIVKQK